MERWKAKREREGKGAARPSGGGTDIEDGPNSSSAASMRESNKRRLEIQRRRQEQRTNYESGSESEGVSSRRSGKLKAIQDRLKTPTKERLRRTLEKADEEDSDEENKVDNDQEEEDAEGINESITKLRQPRHWLPLVVAPMSRESESKQQPSLAIPAPYPNISSESIYNAITNSSTGIQKLKESSQTLRYASRDYMNHFDVPMGGSANDHDDGRESGGSELEMLIKSPSNTNISSLHDVENSASGFVSIDRAFDGMYIGNTASMAAVQLRSEEMAMVDGFAGGERMSKLNLPTNVHLSRATQRIIRDIPGIREENEIRASSKADEIKQQLLRPDKKFGALLCVPEDQFESDNVSEPMIHEPYIMYGGELGQWGERFHDNERYGATIDASNDSHDDSRALLNVHAGMLTLEEHPIMIEEERLAVQLKQLYSQYCLLYENSAMFFLVSRLNTVIESLEDLLGQANKYDDDNDDAIEQKETMDMIEYLMKDILESVPAIRDLRDNANDLTHTLYDTWRKIKKVRHDQGFTSTVVSLKPVLIKDKKSVNNRSSDNSKIDEDIDDNSHTNAIYKTDEIWSHVCNNLLPKLVGSDNLISRALAVVKMNPFDKRSENSYPDSAGDGISNLSKKMHQVDTRGNDRWNKPNVLKECIADLTSNKAEAKKGIIPEVGFKLTESDIYTPDNACDNADELLRRNKISTLKFKARLSMTNLSASSYESSTAYCSVTFPGLKVEFDHTFQISLIHEPANIYINICTPGGWGSELICASIVSPLPGQKAISSGSALGGAKSHTVTSAYAPIASSYSFSSSQTYEVSSSFGTYVSRSDNKEKSRFIGGSLFMVTEFELMSTPFTKNIDGIKAEDVARLPKPSIDAMKRGQAMGVADFVKEKDFLKLMPKLSELDVNDPRNANLLDMIMAAGGVVSGKNVLMSSAFSSDKMIFRLNNDENNLLLQERGVSYANFMKLQQSLRIKLLQLRSKKPYLFSGPIPLNEETLKRSDLYKNIIASASPGDTLENGKLISEDTAGGISASDITEDDDYGDTSRGSKRKVNDFMNRVRESQQLLAKPMQKFIMTSHIISEVDNNPSWDWIHFWSLAWLIPERTRRLKPSGKSRTPKVIQVRKCDLLVQVVSAKNIPVKVDKDGSIASASVGRQNRNTQMKRAKSRRRLDNDVDSADGSVEDESDEDDVWGQDHSAEAETFVEVRFQESTARTTSVPGKAPLWKQTLKLPFKAPQGDYSPSSVEQVRADVHVSIFDEILKKTSSYLDDDDDEERIERRFLGSVTIPFNTIATEGKIEGVFRVRTPSFNWGYGVSASEFSSIDKTEMIEPPSILNCFGFLKPKDESNRSGIKGRDLDSTVESELNYYATGSSSMFVKLMITLDPMIMLVESKDAIDDTSPSFLALQDRPLAGYAHRFLQELRSQGSHTASRPYMLFAPDSSGQYVFIPRYLSAMKPPMQVDTVRACIHLVSQVPFASDVHTFGGAVDMWCQVSQIWEMVAGDEEEHATLLYNYIYYITSQKRGKDVKNDMFICLGSAIPEGRTVYVIVHESVVVEGGNQAGNDGANSSSSRSSCQEWLVINPVNGFVFSAADPNCPLLEIACLVSPDNVYANIAKDARPCETSFDLSNSDFWRPFFGARFPLPQNGISPIQMQVKYTPTLTTYALDIERSLTSNVKNTLRRIRGQRRLSATTFHPDACNCVRDILSTIDDFMLGKESSTSNSMGRTLTRERSGTRDRTSRSQDKSSGSTVQNRFQQLIAERMSGILRNKELCGFPINTPFTDIDEITEMIKSLCVHENKHPEVQFVFAVRAIPYTNQMISLWFFLGTLENM